MEVRFTGGMFGSFMQWITFDFGSRPVLVRKLNVELGVQIVQDKVQQLRKQLDFFRCVFMYVGLKLEISMDALC